MRLAVPKACTLMQACGLAAPKRCSDWQGSNKSATAGANACMHGCFVSCSLYSRSRCMKKQATKGGSTCRAATLRASRSYAARPHRAKTRHTETRQQQVQRVEWRARGSERDDVGSVGHDYHSCVINIRRWHHADLLTPRMKRCRVWCQRQRDREAHTLK